MLQLTNRSDDSMAFRVKANRSKYLARRPDEGVLSPWSKCYVVATMLPQEHAPQGMKCSDVFVVQSTSAGNGLPGNGEVTLPVVYVA